MQHTIMHREEQRLLFVMYICLVMTLSDSCPSLSAKVYSLYISIVVALTDSRHCCMVQTRLALTV